MTIDDRINELMGCLPYANKTEGGVKGFEQILRLAFVHVARDQRHACVEALKEANPHPMWSVEAQSQAVMNATIK